MKGPNPQPVPVSRSERIEWLDIAASRDVAPLPKDRETLQAYCRSRSRRRWRRFQRDYKYFGKVLKRLDMNPEDARWLL